jgi:hypothetical protein
VDTATTPLVLALQQTPPLQQTSGSRKKFLVSLLVLHTSLFQLLQGSLSSISSPLPSKQEAISMVNLQ